VLDSRIMVHLDSSAGCRCIAVQYFNLVQLILFRELTNKLQVATIRESWGTWRLVLRDSCNQLIDSGMTKRLWKVKLTFLRCYIHIGYPCYRSFRSSFGALFVECLFLLFLFLWTQMKSLLATSHRFENLIPCNQTLAIYLQWRWM
jgi:hypothetical protein